MTDTLVVTTSVKVEVIVRVGSVIVVRMVDVREERISEVTAGAVEVTMSVNESVSVSVVGTVDGGKPEVIVVVLGVSVMTTVVVEAGRSVVISLVGPDSVTVIVVEAAETIDVMVDVAPGRV